MTVEAEPYTKAELALLARIRKEVEATLKSTRAEAAPHPLGTSSFWAARNRDYYNLENHLYIPRRPAEEEMDYADRPKRTSNMTRRAVEILCDHLYNPGPARRVEGDDAADKWLAGVYRDNHVDSLMGDADKFSTLNGTVVIQAAATGEHDRPIRLHLWDRPDFEAWAEPGDPLKPFAVCTITRFDEQTTYEIWTRLQYLVYRTAKAGDTTPMGGRVAEFIPAESGEHGYGVLPFSLVPYEPPTQGLECCGIGSALARANALVDIALSDIAEAIHFYNRPMGFARNVATNWRPRIRPGSFTSIPGRERNATGAGPDPEVFFLQAALDVVGAWADITNFVTQTLDEVGVPRSSYRLEQSGAVSGIAIVAEQAPLLTRASKRQRPALRYETDLARVCLAVGGAYYDLPNLLACAADPKLCLIWPEVRIPIPGPDRDESDQAELDMGLTSKIQVLMRRRGITREQAVDELEQVVKDEAELAEIRAGQDPPQPPEPGTPADDTPSPGDGKGIVPTDDEYDEQLEYVP